MTSGDWLLKRNLKETVYNTNKMKKQKQKQQKTIHTYTHKNNIFILIKNAKLIYFFKSVSLPKRHSKTCLIYYTPSIITYILVNNLIKSKLIKSMFEHKFWPQFISILSSGDSEFWLLSQELWG